mgnify:CR=1 FL=1
MGVWSNKNSSMVKTLMEKVKMCERMKNYVMYVMSGMRRRIRIG